MMRTKWTIRLGILGAVVVSVAVLANTDGTAAATSAAQAGFTVSGVHANEAFCKTMIRQGDLAAEYMKQQQPLSPDMTKRAKYFNDVKALNATLVKTAPALFASDVARAMKNSDALADAQLANNSKAILAAAAAVGRSPEQLAAAKRMGDYCGIKL